MNNVKAKNKGEISVADITIAQLSRGLYRSNATAFKELISNAYDADATIVRIDTNYPEFDFISCVDDGTGMSREQFLRYFSDEGIGSCIKRKNKRDKTEKFNRPVIGRLGIGMLAIGQLCHSFEIESHYEGENGEGEAYHAEIVLLDLTIPDKEEIIRNDDTETKEMTVGTWEYQSIDYDETKKGFRIYSSDVRNTFRREMRSSIGKKESQRISFSLSDLHSEFYDKSNGAIRNCKPYLETIWELAILCPLPYYGEKEEYPINLSTFKPEERKSEEFQQAAQFIQNRQEQFLKEKFRIIFDGIELRRHIQLPTEEEITPKLYFVEFDETVFDLHLKFFGYFFAQVSKAIKPLELNGVQIRLRGVGIGGYDSTFLRYYKELETIRWRWVSGEIFVDEGLESALNIDRDSFNEHDEHFKKLQSVLHDKLETVFKEINKAARMLSEGKREEKERKLKENLQTIVIEQSKGEFKLLQQDSGNDFPIIEVDEDKGEIILNTAARPLKKKKADMIIRDVMLAYHAVKHTAETEEERENQFYQLVKKIIGELV